MIIKHLYSNVLYRTIKVTLILEYLTVLNFKKYLSCTFLKLKSFKSKVRELFISLRTFYDFAHCRNEGVKHQNVRVKAVAYKRQKKFWNSIF